MTPDYPPIKKEAENYEGKLSACCTAPVDNKTCIACKKHDFDNCPADCAMCKPESTITSPAEAAIDKEILSKCCDAQMQDDNNQCMTCGACGICESSGELPAMGAVYPGEPHQAPIDSVPCWNCRSSEPDDFSGATEGDR